jgi:N-acetylneuraminic acid mutarotase
MKKILLSVVVIFINNFSNAQPYAWTQKASFGGGTRYAGAGFSIGTKGYIGTGITHVGLAYTYHSDFWEWDQTTNIWTQKASLPGPPRYGANGFSIGLKGYISLGWSPTQLNDLWEYNPSTNTWLQKTNFGGSARYDAASFVINDFAYVGTGYAPYHNDFWKYDPTTDSWTQIANVGGPARSTATGFSIGSYGYVACGSQQFVVYTADLWRYNSGTNTWSQMTNFIGPARTAASAFSFNGKGYLGVGCTDVSVFTDFYSYDPPTDTWSPIAGFPGQGLIKTVTFSIGNRGYMGTGSDDIYPGGLDRSEFWEYGPVTTGIDETGFSNNEIKIYTSQNILKIEFTKSIEKDLYLKIFNLEGKIIYSEILYAGFHFYDVDLKGKASGNYLFEINNGNLKVKSGKVALL